jgi:hypothetical protein
MTEQELTTLCIEWQKILSLQDWRMVVRIKRMRDMPEGMQGSVNITWTRKEAVISILDPIDYPLDCTWEQDMEQVLVHELLHLHYAEDKDVDEDDERHIALEQGIQMTAWALVDLKRGKAGHCVDSLSQTL